MKKIDFTHIGGFPLRQNTLDFMQKGSKETLSAFLAWITQQTTFPVVFQTINVAYIIAGVKKIFVNGQESYGEGWVVRNGELLYFAGASFSSVEEHGIGISETVEHETFKNNDTHPVFFTKVAVAGGTFPIPIENYVRVLNPSDVQPSIAREVSWDFPQVQPDGYATESIVVEDAKVGDHVVIDWNYHDLNFADALAFTFLPIRAAVLYDGQVQVIAHNQWNHPLGGAGPVNINLKIIK